jgi:HPt (histidine-containing phosphotransfer) domain-containing protein
VTDQQAEAEILDTAFLGRQTFGDASLARELIDLFAEQCRRLGPVIDHASDPAERLAAAHSLKGAARAVGAGRIATLTDGIEAALERGEPATALVPLAQALATAIEAFEHRLAALATDL